MSWKRDPDTKLMLNKLKIRSTKMSFHCVIYYFITLIRIFSFENLVGFVPRYTSGV